MTSRILLLPLLVACTRPPPAAAPSEAPDAPAEAPSAPQGPAFPTRLPDDVVELVPPCARTRDGAVWCWSDAEGAEALTRMDLPPVKRVLPLFRAACGWTDDGLVCTPGASPEIGGGLGLGEVWFDHDTLVRRGGHQPKDHFQVRPQATEVVDTGCPSWDFGLVWRVGDRLESDCLQIDLQPLADTVSLTGGRDHVCGVHPDGGVTCLGLSERSAPLTSRADHRIEGLTDAVEVALGREIGCARHETGRVSCFGASRALKGLFGDILTHHGDPHPPVDIGVEGVTALYLEGQDMCLAQGPRVQCGSGNQPWAFLEVQGGEMGEDRPLHKVLPPSPMPTVPGVPADRSHGG